MIFKDRFDAGFRLAEPLARYRTENPLVIGLPRGGVEVAYPISVALGAPLDIWCVRKVGAPGREELGLGAVAEGGVVHLDQDFVSALGVSESALTELVARKQSEVASRVRLFRQDAAPPAITGRTVIVVDDGLATGGTAMAALMAIRARKPRRLVLAVPVAAPSSLRRAGALADDVVALEAPEDLIAIGAWYEDFRQVSDERVLELLETRRDALEQRRLRT